MLDVNEGQENGRQPRTPRERAIDLISRGEYEAAIDLLKGQANGDANGHELLGTAYYLSERYADAAYEFGAAADRSGGAEQERCKRRQALALANEAAGLELVNPQPREFTLEELLAPPSIGEHDLPPPPPPPPKSLRRTVFRAMGAVSGKAIDLAWRGLAPLARLRHEHRGSLWTDWDEKGLYSALVALAYMRDQLEKNNLVDPYPKGERTAFQSPTLTAPSPTRSFRTPDGSWNDPHNPREGSANVRFPRNVPLVDGHPEAGARLHDPNPAEVSQALLARGPEGPKTVDFLNLHAAAWIQFMVHGWVSHRSYAEASGPGKTLSVEIPKEHPLRAEYHQRRMLVGKTMPDPSRRAEDGTAPAATINEISSWWDGSQLYGSDLETQKRLRSGQGGKLRLVDDHLPIEGGVEQTGYNRNWWVGLSVLHTLFARDHNSICEMLQKKNPTWDDDRLFNVARLINAAVMAKIHTVEWTPAILPNPTLKVALESNWFGLVENRLHRRQRKVLRRVKIRHGVFGGLVGNPVEKYGKPYGLSEEFVEVYRLHELLPDVIQIRHRDPHRPVDVVTLPETRGRAAADLWTKHGMADLLYSFGTQHPGQLVLHNYPDSLRQLAVPGAPALDVAAIDILRARERGVPRYNAFRRALGLRPIRNFGDLTSNADDVRTLEQVYGDVENIDMQVGTRAEEHRPKGFGFGETLFQIFILNASRRLQADHFFTDGYTPENYTQEGLDWIDDATFKTVLLRHHGELRLTGLANVTNAFEPWDTDAVLDPERHPLSVADQPGLLQRAVEGTTLALEARARGTKQALSELGQRADAALTWFRAVVRWGAGPFDDLPPGSFGVPIFGESLKFVAGTGPFLEERFHEYGTIFKTHVAFHPTVCLGGEKAYSFFMNDEYFTRVKGAPLNVRWLFDEKSLSFKDGPEQKRVQKLLLDAFEDREMARYLPRLDALFTSKIAEWVEAQAFEWLPELEEVSFGIIDTAFMGGAPCVDKAFWTRQFDRLTCGVVRTPFSPELYLALVVRLLFKGYVKQVIARRKQTPGDDVVSALLRPRLAGGDFLKDDELEIELVHFFLAGAPLESALAYHLLLLAQHPRVMARARREVRQNWRAGPLDLATIRSLTYVLQTCRESRRTARLVPNTFFATVKKTFDFEGFRVPAGWKAMGLIGCTQHDSNVFAFPEKYDPDRFAGECPMYVAHGGNGDPHRCIGERFSDVVMTMLTARLLRDYTWDLVPGQDLGPRPGKVAPVPAGGLEVVFTRLEATR